MVEITMTHGGKSDIGVVNGLQIIQRNPARLYVNHTAGPIENGLSWTNAFKRLSDAVLAAASGPQLRIRACVWVGARTSAALEDFMASGTRQRRKPSLQVSVLSGGLRCPSGRFTDDSAAKTSP
jgi:hypothetical protein